MIIRRQIAKNKRRKKKDTARFEEDKKKKKYNHRRHRQVPQWTGESHWWMAFQVKLQAPTAAGGGGKGFRDSFSKVPIYIPRNRPNSVNRISFLQCEDCLPPRARSPQMIAALRWLIPCTKRRKIRSRQLETFLVTKVSYIQACSST